MTKTKKQLLKYLREVANGNDETATPNKQFSAIKVMLRYDKQGMIDKLEEIVDMNSEKSIIAADILLRIVENDKTPRMDVNFGDKTEDTEQTEQE